jgi:histone H3/H4
MLTVIIAVALREIRKLQRATGEKCVIPKAPMARLIREILANLGHPNFRVTGDMLETVQLLVKDEFTRLFSCKLY